MKRTVAIVMFDKAHDLDFLGPWEVFGMLRNAAPGEVDVFTVGENGGEVRSDHGMRIIADHSFATAPRIDVLIVPGGAGRKKQVENPRMIEFLRKTAEQAELVASVCTGTFLLERAGLLAGKRATTHWAAMSELGKLGTVQATPQRVVDEGKVITAAGVSAGIDMALYIVGRLWGPDTARKVQKGMEYFPQPPYQDASA